MKQNKILILSGSYGDGHQQAAHAIRAAASIAYPGFDVQILDFMEVTHPLLNPISRYLFMHGIKKLPSVHGYLYHKTRSSKTPMMLKTFTLASAKRLLNVLRNLQPAVVISTFPFAAAAMSILKSHHLVDVHAVTVITDHTDHSYWIHPHTDQYIVGSEQVYSALCQSGIWHSQIAMTGIPIRPEFSVSYSRDELKAKHKLNPHLPTVLIMGGGWGIIGNGVSSLVALEEIPQQIQFIVVCGRNEKLRKQLAEKVHNSKHKIHLTGFVDHIHEFMAVSDLMITKPGGLTTSEAIAMQLPMLLYKPLPGQEQDNAKFLLRAGVADLAEDLQDLVEKLKTALEHPDILKTMKEKTQLFQTKEAAFTMLEIVMDRINGKNRLNQIHIS